MAGSNGVNVDDIVDVGRSTTLIASKHRDVYSLQRDTRSVKGQGHEDISSPGQGNAELEEKSVREGDLGGRDPDTKDFGKPGAPSKGSHIRTTCDCGYDSDYESDESKLPRNDISGRRWRQEARDLSRSYRHYIKCTAKGFFPLTKLPVEIRWKIFVFTIPDDRTWPLYEPEVPSSDDWLFFDSRSNSSEDWEPNLKPADVIPASLFRTNKSISTEAVEIFHKEFYFRIDISPFDISVCNFGYWPRGLESFDNNKTLAKWRPFASCRNYHLNIKSSVLRWEQLMTGLMERVPANYQDGSDRIKEWLRIISDELSSKNVIQNLTITAPCRCALQRAGRLPQDETRLLDLFIPLKRVRVPNPIRLSLHDDIHSRGIHDPCSEPDCCDLASNIQTSLGRLEGDALSEQEVRWQELKEILRHKYEMRLEADCQIGYDWMNDAGEKFDGIWKSLNNKGPRDFEEAVQDYLSEQARQESRSQAMRELQAQGKH